MSANGLDVARPSGQLLPGRAKYSRHRYTRRDRKHPQEHSLFGMDRGARGSAVVGLPNLSMDIVNRNRLFKNDGAFQLLFLGLVSIVWPGGPAKPSKAVSNLYRLPQTCPG